MSHAYGDLQPLTECCQRIMDRDTLDILEKRIRKGVPKILCSYLINWCCDTRNVTALDIPELDRKTPQAWLIGETDDISHLLMHDFYDPVEYILKPAGDNPTYPKEDKYQII